MYRLRLEIRNSNGIGHDSILSFEIASGIDGPFVYANNVLNGTAIMKNISKEQHDRFFEYVIDKKPHEWKSGIINTYKKSDAEGIWWMVYVECPVHEPRFLHKRGIAFGRNYLPDQALWNEMMTALDELIPESKIGYFFNHADLISYNIDPHEKRDPDIELFDAVTGEKIDGAGDFYREKRDMRFGDLRLQIPSE